MTTPRVTQLKLHQQSQQLALHFSNGLIAQLSAEFLRVHSPSAEVQGHGTPVLVTGKQGVRILTIQPVGNYAVRLIFNDGHDSGIYSWSWFHQLATHQDELWQAYQEKLTQKQKEQALRIPIHVSFNNH